MKTIGSLVGGLHLPEPEEGWEVHDAKVGAARDLEWSAAKRTAAEDAALEMASWGVPVKDVERVAAARLDDTEAMSAAREHVAAGILVLSGPKGCGKTTAASWWVSRPGPSIKLLSLGPPLFVSAFQLQRWSAYDKADMERVERARRMVLDDVGTEYMDTKGHLQSFLDGVVNARYAATLPLAMTTNLPAAEFKRRFGERIADRIREVGRFVELKQTSLRGRQ